MKTSLKPKSSGIKGWDSLPQWIRYGCLSLSVLGFWVNSTQAVTNPEAEMAPVPDEAFAQALRDSKNLLRWHMGAQFHPAPWDADVAPIGWTTPDPPSAANILSDDISQRFTAAPGVTEFVIDLGEFYAVDRLLLRNLGTSGTIRLATANALLPPESRRWSQLGGDIVLDPQAAYLTRELPRQEVRFLRMRFAISGGGELGPFFLGGDLSIGDAAPSLPDSETLYADPDATMVGLNLATIPIGARITHVSSGNPLDAPYLIDDDPESPFTFYLEDGDSIFVVAYPETYRFDRAVYLMESGRGTLELYGFTQLPDILTEGEKTQTVRIPEEFFADREPAASLVIEEPTNFASMELNQLDARYMMVRWIGINNPTPRFVVSKFAAIGSIPEQFAAYQVMQVFTFASPETEPTPETTPTDDPPRLPAASP